MVGAVLHWFRHQDIQSFGCVLSVDGEGDIQFTLWRQGFDA